MDSGGRGQIGLQAVKVIQDIRRQRTVGTSNSRGKGNSGQQRIICRTCVCSKAQEIPVPVEFCFQGEAIAEEEF